MSQEKTSVGVRIHDIHHGLVQSTGAVVETELWLLKELGAAIQIATTIKDHEVISDLKPFYAAAGELKISKPLAKEALLHLQSLGFVRLKVGAAKADITRIDVVVPELARIYHDFGDYFVSENDSEVAESMVTMIDKLSLFPRKEKDILSQLEISPDKYNVIKDVAQATSLLDTYTSPRDSESIAYSPIYWDDNPGKIFELLEKHNPEKLAETLQVVKGCQGIPGEKISDEVLIDAIRIGCLPSLGVDSSSGLKKFVFTPQLGVGETEKVLLHKARVLLSCVRYGENFAGITRINDPERLLEVLAGRGYLGGHTESLKQYESARNHGLVQLIPTTAGRYEVHFVDNEENRAVVRMALEMLEVGEASKQDDSQEVAKQILLPDSLQHPIQTRTHVLKSEIGKSRASLVAINDLLRGIDV